MPKQKTHSGTKDRIRITKTGKVLRGRAMGNHFLRKKSAAKKTTSKKSSTKKTTTKKKTAAKKADK